MKNEMHIKDKGPQTGGGGKSFGPMMSKSKACSESPKGNGPAMHSANAVMKGK